MTDGGVRRVVRAMTRVPLSLWSSLLVAAVLAAGVAAGEIMPHAVTRDIAELEVGSQLDTGPFLLTVERARVLDELPGVSESDDSTRVVALVVTVSANGPRTLTGAMLADSVALHGVAGLATDAPTDGRTAARTDGPPAPPDVFVMADGSRLDALQPGLEYEVAMVWEQSSAYPAPTDVEVVVVGRTLRESSIDRSTEWLDRATAAVGQVPITPADVTTSGDGE